MWGVLDIFHVEEHRVFKAQCVPHLQDTQRLSSANTPLLDSYASSARGPRCPCCTGAALHVRLAPAPSSWGREAFHTPLPNTRRAVTAESKGTLAATPTVWLHVDPGCKAPGLHRPSRNRSAPDSQLPCFPACVPLVLPFPQSESYRRSLFRGAGVGTRDYAATCSFNHLNTFSTADANDNDEVSN